MYHHKKYRFKKKYKNILFLTFAIIILIYIQINNPFEHNFKLCKKKFFKTDNFNLKNKIIKSVFNDISFEYKNSMYHDKVYDDMFFVNEIKENEPIIYLYNTHQTEKYARNDVSEFIPSIMTATSYLNEKLNNFNIPAMMEYRSVSKALNENNWKYGYSYKVSRTFLEDSVNKNPSIKYLFDIHRDSGSHESTTLCVNDKCYAKLLFLIGLENPNYEPNLNYAEELSNMLNQKVDKISKGILQKQGKNVNGIYNQDFSSRTILIEVGGENNTIDEVYNSLDVLSEVIKEYIYKEMNT